MHREMILCSGSDSDVSIEDETNTSTYYDSASNWKHDRAEKMKSVNSLFMKLTEKTFKKLGSA